MGDQHTMFLNEDFLVLYEMLSELNESKADTQKLIDFAGEDLANRFLTVKSRLKAPENDLYYWIKNKQPEDLEATVFELENTKSSSRIRKDAIDGGVLVYETDHWKVYHITSFEASKYYGRDTKWCITGINDYGDKYWKQYTESGIQFYFLITKGEYNPRGRNSKFAFAIKQTNAGYYYCEIYDQQDNRVTSLKKIPYSSDIKIPAIDMSKLIVAAPADSRDVTLCHYCGQIVDDNTGWHVESCITIYDEICCQDCWPDYLETDEGKAELLLQMSIGYYEDFEPEIWEDNSLQEIIKSWSAAKNVGTLRFSAEEIENIEKRFIHNLNKYNIKTDLSLLVR
jgi:hypothetical protein